MPNAYLIKEIIIQNIMKRIKPMPENACHDKEKIQSRKLKSKKEIGSAKRTIKYKNKLIVFSNSMKVTDYLIELNYKLIDCAISRKLKIG